MNPKNHGSRLPSELPRLKSNFNEVIGTYQDVRSLSVSDPAPTTTVVTGSETDASAVPKASSEKPILGVVSKRGGGGWKNARELLDDREKRLLMLCYEHGFLSRKLLAQGLLKDRAIRTVDRVLDQLSNNRLIKRNVRGLLAGKGVYSLSKQGWQLAREFSSYDIPKPRVRVETFEHDELLIEVRHLCETHLGGKWIPELHLRQQNFEENPDGVLVFPNGIKIAIEVENSVKARNRIIELMSRWGECDITMALYIPTHSAVERFLKKTITESGLEGPIGVLPLDGLRYGNLCTWTKNGEKSFRRIDE